MQSQGIKIYSYFVLNKSNIVFVRMFREEEMEIRCSTNASIFVRAGTNPSYSTEDVVVSRSEFKRIKEDIEGYLGVELTMVDALKSEA